ncbi:MAG: 4Fe-4S binding protein [Deltaproteobacteria bacterium]|nr:4Fe-4S binding protein [Deltaproteobacteria bacterium]
MTVTKLRYITQHVAFLLFTYGGFFRINLGQSIPCLSCPFIYSCTGFCYLMMLQRALGLMFLPLNAAFGGPDPWFAVREAGGQLLIGLLIFSILVVILGKSWCGWLCPFGLIQDWITRLRRKLGIRESEIILKKKEKLTVIKYILLAYLIIMPILAGLGVLPFDFILAFCNICPAKALMPLFAGDAQYIALDTSTRVALGFSLALLAITASMLIGMFFKDRFFCLFCPMLALLNFYKKLYVLKLAKEPLACHGCGNCRRTCSMDNETVYRERVKSDVYDTDCMGCFKCVEGCAADKSLQVKVGPLKVFTSSRRYASRV